MYPLGEAKVRVDPQGDGEVAGAQEGAVQALGNTIVSKLFSYYGHCDL